MVTLYTFGDSILDCARYNAHRVHPGQLLVRNDDAIFPEFKGQDLASRGPARLVHRAVDGATSRSLASQGEGVTFAPDAVILLTVGGNDLIGGLAGAEEEALEPFRDRVASFVERLPRGRVLVGTVYDPTFGDDAQNFLGIDPRVARANHRRVNDVLTQLGEAHGAAVDIHGHFLTGDPSWYTSIIEPSLTGASEVRRAFLPHVMRLAEALTAQR